MPTKFILIQNESSEDISSNQSDLLQTAQFCVRYTLHPHSQSPLPSLLTETHDAGLPLGVHSPRVTDPWGVGQAQEKHLWIMPVQLNSQHLHEHFSYNRKFVLFGHILSGNTWGVKIGVHNCAHLIFAKTHTTISDPSNPNSNSVNKLVLVIS